MEVIEAIYTIEMIDWLHYWFLGDLSIVQDDGFMTGWDDVNEEFLLSDQCQEEEKYEYFDELIGSVYKQWGKWRSIWDIVYVLHV